MKVLLMLLSAAVAVTLATPVTAYIFSSSNCIYVESSDAIDSSGVIIPEEVTLAMEELSGAGLTEFKEFWMIGNHHITHLPYGMLGDVRFTDITITNNYFLASIGDILGASKTTVSTLDLSMNHLGYLPRMESTSLTHFKMTDPYLTSIASNALNAVPNLKTVELEQAGQANSAGLVISDGAFSHLPHLEELNLKDYFPKDGHATRGSFNFNSESLHTVNLISSMPIYTAEAGTFDGFNANTTLSILLNAPIAVESFYSVFNSGSKVVVQEPQPCQCNLDWVKYSCFLPQASIRCVYRQDYMDLAEVPDSSFDRCCFGKH